MKFLKKAVVCTALLSASVNANEIDMEYHAQLKDGKVETQIHDFHQGTLYNLGYPKENPYYENDALGGILQSYYYLPFDELYSQNSWYVFYDKLPENVRQMDMQKVKEEYKDDFSKMLANADTTMKKLMNMGDFKVKNWLGELILMDSYYDPVDQKMTVEFNDASGESEYLRRIKQGVFAKLNNNVDVNKIKFDLSKEEAEKLAKDKFLSVLYDMDFKQTQTIPLEEIKKEFDITSLYFVDLGSYYELSGFDVIFRSQDYSHIIKNVLPSCQLRKDCETQLKKLEDSRGEIKRITLKEFEVCKGPMGVQGADRCRVVTLK